MSTATEVRRIAARARPRLKKALVTGGTRGIGAAVAAELVKAGLDVTVTGTSPQGKFPARCRYVNCDFSDTGQLGALLRAVAEMELSILVNNAGINKVGPTATYGLEDFLRIQQVNVVAPFRLCQAVVPGMCQRRFGRIVNMTSIFGVVSKAGRAAYSASKCGLFGLSRALALEVAAHNVLVNCLAPGFVDTEMTHHVLGEQGIAEMVRLIPIGRLATPEEIAKTVRFLVSPENTYLTGQQIIVDGGFTCA